MKWISLLITLAFSFPCRADFELGVGTTSATNGRSVPSLAAAVSSESVTWSLFSTGVQTKPYYQSTYGLAYYKTWTAGDFWGGQVVSGFGIGSFVSMRGFKDGTAEEETSSDFGIGPSIRVNWTPFGPLYFNFEGTYGLRDIGAHLTLNFQDLISFSLGVRM